MAKHSSNEDPNAITVRAYNERPEEYLDAPTNRGSPQVKRWIDASLRQVPIKGKILEIGSGSGSDAEYIESHGYNIELTDAAESLVRRLLDAGRKARVLNIVTDAIKKEYDLIFCSAVLQHLTRDQVSEAVTKIHAALKEKGIFSVSVSKGKGESWTERRLGMPRYFSYWEQAPFKDLLVSKGFDVVYADSDDMWLRFVAQKS